MDKPKKEIREAWNFFKILKYIEKKYNVNSDALEIWFCDDGDFHNGCYSYLQISEYLSNENVPSEVKNILQLLLDEFEEKEMYIWIAW